MRRSLEQIEQPDQQNQDDNQENYILTEQRRISILSPVFRTLALQTLAISRSCPSRRPAPTTASATCLHITMHHQGLSLPCPIVHNGTLHPLTVSAAQNAIPGWWAGLLRPGGAYSSSGAPIRPRQGTKRKEARRGQPRERPWFAGRDGQRRCPPIPAALTASHYSEIYR